MALKVGQSCQLEGRSIIVEAENGMPTAESNPYWITEGERGTMCFIVAEEQDEASLNNRDPRNFRFAVVWDRDQTRKPRPVPIWSLTVVGCK